MGSATSCQMNKQNELNNFTSTDNCLLHDEFAKCYINCVLNNPTNNSILKIVRAYQLLLFLHVGNTLSLTDTANKYARVDYGYFESYGDSLSIPNELRSVFTKIFLNNVPQNDKYVQQNIDIDCIYLNSFIKLNAVKELEIQLNNKKQCEIQKMNPQLEREMYCYERITNDRIANLKKLINML